MPRQLSRLLASIELARVVRLEDDEEGAVPIHRDRERRFGSTSRAALLQRTSDRILSPPPPHEPDAKYTQGASPPARPPSLNLSCHHRPRMVVPPLSFIAGNVPEDLRVWQYEVNKRAREKTFYGQQGTDIRLHSAASKEQEVSAPIPLRMQTAPLPTT